MQNKELKSNWTKVRTGIMFQKIFIEKALKDKPQVEKILKKFSQVPYYFIPNYQDVFGVVKKPYSVDERNLFLAHKKGQLVKETPMAYGMGGSPHYYFIHSYNCIYRCDYCYLQGYFDSPDIVLFLNHEEILEQMAKALNQHPQETVWFHSGEFSDSLALSDLTGEIEKLYLFFKENPRAILELRTKSVKVNQVLNLRPLDNFIISFSLSPQDQAKEHDILAPSIEQRLKALKALSESGHSLGLHLDPLIINPDFETHFKLLIASLKSSLGDINSIKYLSLGVVRFTKEVYHAIESNHKNAEFLKQDLSKSFDGKIRYPKPYRISYLNYAKELLVNAGLEEQKIYLCME